MKHTLEDLIKAERALEAALVRTLTVAFSYDTAGNKNAAEAVMRERRDMQRAQNIVGAVKARLQALAENSKIVTRGTKRRKVLCCNGNTVERFYDRGTRSSVTVVRDAAGNQIGEADYDGNNESAAFAMRAAIATNGGESVVQQ